MDEKEIIKRIKNSYKAKKSESEIVRALQKKGYKLEYIHDLIRQAKKPKRVFINSIIILIILSSLFFGIYAKYQFHIINEKFEEMSKWKTNLSEVKEKEEIKLTSDKTNPITEDKEQTKDTTQTIEITTDKINSLLKYLNLDLLNKHPLTQEPPILNLEIGKYKFYTQIENGNPKTKKGSSLDADIIIDTTIEEFTKAITSNSPLTEFSNSIYNTKTSVEMISSNTELFAKGYLSFYESISNQKL